MFQTNCINTYGCIKNPNVISSISINNWFKSISNSDYSETILKARNGELDYNKTKESLPCVTYNFLFDSYKKDKNIISSTGFLYIDIDNNSFNVKNLDLNKVFAYYKSFGGNGYAIIVKVDGLNLANFNLTYANITEDLGIDKYVDKQAIKATQFNVLSYDKNIYINENSYSYTAVNINTPQSYVIEKKERAYTLEWGENYIKRDKIRFDNIDEIEIPEGEDYIVDWEGIEVIKCWIPIHKKDYNRNNLLLAYCNNLLWLNPNITREKAFEILIKVNQIAFYEPVDNSQLNRVLNSVFNYLKEGTLEPIYFNKKRKIIFDSKCRLSGDDKRSIVISELAKMKSENSRQKLYEIIEDWDFKKYGKITQAQVYKNFSISSKTVEKYWKEFKEYIKELNEDYK